MKLNKSLVSKLLIIVMLFAVLTILTGCSANGSVSDIVDLTLGGLMVSLMGVLISIFSAIASVFFGIISIIGGIFALIGELIMSLF